MPCCWCLGHLFGRPDCLAKLPAPLSTLASSTAALHSRDPPNLLFLADYPPNFSGMKVPGACKASWFCSGLQKYSSKAACEGGQGQSSLPINTSENFQTLPPSPPPMPFPFRWRLLLPAGIILVSRVTSCLI